MAIRADFISIIIPLEKIESCTNIGGLEGVLAAKGNAVGERILCDGYLYREAAMSPTDAEDIAKFWEQQGLTMHEWRDGVQYWKDMCCVDMLSGPTLPCDWIEFVERTNDQLAYVYLKGAEPGEIIKPTSEWSSLVFLPTK